MPIITCLSGPFYRYERKGVILGNYVASLINVLSYTFLQYLSTMFGGSFSYYISSLIFVHAHCSKCYEIGVDLAIESQPSPEKQPIYYGEHWNWLHDILSAFKFLFAVIKNTQQKGKVP